MMGSYLKNCWYGLAWSEELAPGSLLNRTALGVKIVVFRGESGAVGALIDRCPHRFAPLSRGEVVGDAVRCGYHGLVFSHAGTCVAYHFGDPPAAAKVKAFPVVERHKMIWFWPGDPAKADPNLIPEYRFHDIDDDGEDWAIFGHALLNSNYENETDNLLDLSHIEFLHRPSFGGRGAINAGSLRVHDHGSEIHANWWMPNIPRTGRVSEPGDVLMVDHFLDMRWNAPSNLRLHVGNLPEGRFADRAETLRTDLPGQFSAHILTPETEASTHYFYSTHRPPEGYRKETEQEQRALLERAFVLEDKPMLEAVEANMIAGFWDEHPVILPNDAAGVRARRRLAKMIRDEQAESEQIDRTG